MSHFLVFKISDKCPFISARKLSSVLQKSYVNSTSVLGHPLSIMLKFCQSQANVFKHLLALIQARKLCPSKVRFIVILNFWRMYFNVFSNILQVVGLSCITILYVYWNILWVSGYGYLRVKQMFLNINQSYFTMTLM